MFGDGKVAASGPVYRQTAPPGADPTLFAANPLLEQMQANRPALVAAAERDDPNPPRLFGDRDLPPFTASGLDPELLAALPWPLRRPVAAMSTMAAAYNLIEQYAGEPDATRPLAQDRANSDYIQRFSLWLSGGGIGAASNAHPPQGLGTRENDPIDARLHAEIFGN